MIRVFAWWLVGSILGIAAAVVATMTLEHLHYIGSTALAVPMILGVIGGLIGSQGGIAIGTRR